MEGSLLVLGKMQYWLFPLSVFNVQDVPVEGKSNLTIALKEDTQALEEVVVVGYGLVRNLI